MKVKHLLIFSATLFFVCSGFLNNNPFNLSIPHSLIPFKSNEPQTGKTGDVPVGLNIGNKAPEIKLLNPDGKEMALSSLKGYLVLIDFWASWCGPCRMENPNVVRAYQTFKDSKFENAKGFRIYNVSLDQVKERWAAAIKADKLDWNHHVSDLKGWGSSAAKLYNVMSIPANFLIDSKGIILAKNLRGPALDNEIKKYVKGTEEGTKKKEVTEMEKHLSK